MTGVKVEADQSVRKSQTSIKNQSAGKSGPNDKSMLNASIESKVSEQSKTIIVQDGDPASGLGNSNQAHLNTTHDVLVHNRDEISPLDIHPVEKATFDTQT